MWKFFAAKFIRYRHQDRCKGVHSRTDSRNQPLRRGCRPDRGNKIRIIDKISEKLCFERGVMQETLFLPSSDNKLYNLHATIPYRHISCHR